MRHGTFKRLLSLLLAMTLVLSLGLTAAFAEDGGGQNTDQQITSVTVTANDTTGTTVSANTGVNISADQDKKTITVGADNSGGNSLPATVTPVTVEVKKI